MFSTYYKQALKNIVEESTTATPDPGQMTLEEQLDWIGLGTKKKRIIIEALKLSEEEQDEFIKKLALQNIEKGRY